MHWMVYDNTVEFYRRVKPLLLKNEACHNLPIGVLNRLLNQKNHSDILMATVEDQQKILGSFLMTPPHHLIVTFHDAEQIVQTAEFAAKNLAASKIKIPSLIGEKHQVTVYAEAWKKVNRQDYKVGMEQRIYQLTEVKDIPESKGIMRLANKEDLSFLGDWVLSFNKETLERSLSREEALQLAEEKVREESLYLWVVNHKPVAMAARTRKTDHGQTVTLVYTPIEERKKGYASSLVKHLSQEILNDYTFCFLYTDLANPTSNKIYTRIGYEPVCDSLVLEIL
ncbi:MAG: GNAT family N-acetyltransferase [Bacillaceae bacterium]|nr:GNAT family N-acetyltransferase [Bacillaceae bacterium]